ncbi:MAG: hypothetical protein HQL69_23980 [Magnetococcales bacterium]|nr:hypothetical protein [Magnetococcales bacterium]
MPEFPDDDMDMRFKVIDPGFTPDQDAVYESAMGHLKEGIAKGLPWKKVADSVQLADAKLKEVVLDDFLKITIAERHFQGGEGLKHIAKSLKVPMDLIVALKASMIEEVSQAAVKVYQMGEKEKKS